MKIPLTLLSSSIILLAFSSCREVSKPKFSFPQYLLHVKDGSIECKCTDDTIFRFVVYYGQNDCSECALSQMKYNLLPLALLSERTSLFKPFIIIVPDSPETCESLIGLTINLNYSWDIWVDPNDECAFLNSSPSRYFLIDDCGQIVYSGLPFVDGNVDINFLDIIGADDVI